MAVKQEEQHHILTRPVPVELNGRPLEPNRRMPLNLDWVEEVRVNTSAVERRASTVGTRRSVKKHWQAAWLLRAIACMDLTTLSGDDSVERVKRLCAKAKHPLQQHIVDKLGIEELNLTTGAVCVYHAFVETAVKALEGTNIHVAAVSTGFPAGLSPLAERVHEIRRSVEAGAQEIDIVITRAHVFNGEWQALYDEVAAFKDACGAAHMKAILGTGDLLTLRNVARASVVAMMAGRRLHQDFHRQRSHQCDHSGFAGDGASHSRLRREDRPGRGLQTGGRHQNGEAIPGMDVCDEG